MKGQMPKTIPATEVIRQIDLLSGLHLAATQRAAKYPHAATYFEGRADAFSFSAGVLAELAGIATSVIPGVTKPPSYYLAQESTQPLATAA